jgi:peptide/nickel transport system substrate-binding protein
MTHLLRSTIGTARFRTGTAAAATVCAVLLAGCSGDGSSEPDSLPVKVEASDADISTLTWAVTSAPRSLDPAHAFDTSSTIVTTELLDPVIGLASDGSLEPRLAESWEEPDSKTIVLKLRSGVTFWDGSPLTPEDVVYSLQRNLDPDEASEISYYFSYVDSISATGDDEVTIKLKEPDPRLIYTLQYALVVQKKHAESKGDALGSPDGLVMGTGAYEPVSFSSAKGVTMTRNEDYWGEKPAAEELKVEVISDPETLRLAVQSGEVDGTFQLPVEKSKTWDAMDDVRISYVPGLITTMLTLDVTQAPFDDIHARRAVAYALDRQGIADALFAGHADPAAQTMVEPSLFNTTATEDEVEALYDELPDYGFDLEKAADELGQSATPDGFEVGIEYPESRPFLGQILQTLAQNLESIGVTLDVKEVPESSWIANLRAEKRPTMGIVALGVDYPSPASLLDAVLAPTGAGTTNYANYRPAELVDAMRQYQVGDPEARFDVLSETMRQLAEDLPYVPVTFQAASVALNSRLTYTGDYAAWTLYGSEWAHNVAAVAD